MNQGQRTKNRFTTARNNSPAGASIYLIIVLNRSIILIMKKEIALISIIALITLGAIAPAAAKALTGATAPDFALTDTHGQSRSLSDYRGSYVILEWTNNLCPFVVKHYDSGNMQAIQKECTDKGMVWLTIISSAPGKQGYLTDDEANALDEAQGFNATAKLIDSKGVAGRLYGAKVTPHMFIINPEGILIYQGAIDSISSADSADIKKADNYILTTLKQDMAGLQLIKTDTKPYGCGIKYAKL